MHLLYNILTAPWASTPWFSLAPYEASPVSYAWGRNDPLNHLNILGLAFAPLYTPDNSIGPSTHVRAGNAVLALHRLRMNTELRQLPLGLSAPLREALRTSQMNPPTTEWPVEAYKMMGREDLWAGAMQTPDSLVSDGYLRVKDVIVGSHDAVSVALKLRRLNRQTRPQEGLLET